MSFVAPYRVIPYTDRELQVYEPNKKALLIGINYGQAGDGELKGPQKDVEDMFSLLVGAYSQDISRIRGPTIIFRCIWIQAREHCQIVGCDRWH
jgi:hypothetical protein